MAVKDLVSLYEQGPLLRQQPQRRDATQRMIPVSARFIHRNRNDPSALPSSAATALMTSMTSAMAATILTNDTNDTNDHDDEQDISDSDTLLPPRHSSSPHSYPPSSSRAATLVPSRPISFNHHSPPRIQMHDHTKDAPVPATTVFARNAPPLHLPKLDNYLASLPAPHFPRDQLVFPPSPAHRQDKSGTGPRERIMFPPMDRLAGRRIEDLENNAKVLPWYDRKAIFGGLTSGVLGITGSSAIATYYSLQGLINTVQIFALIINTIIPVGSQNIISDWKQLILGTLPNILALNFTFAPLLVLLIFILLASLLLYHFYRSTSSATCERYGKLEGVQFPDAPIPSSLSIFKDLFTCLFFCRRTRTNKTQQKQDKDKENGKSKTDDALDGHGYPIIKDNGGDHSSHWGILITTFTLTAIYLPLSTMALHVLVWSSDLWVVDVNPYTNITLSSLSSWTNGTAMLGDGSMVMLPEPLRALGPSEEYRDPLDFCWTTTMKRNEVNWAPLFVCVSLGVVGLLTIWFPITLHRVIKQSVPKVDPYTELGRRRNEKELDVQYVRLLNRDRNPFVFLYKGFRRNWATYMSIYLLIKFSALLIVALISPSNCLFRPSSSILPAPYTTSSNGTSTITNTIPLSTLTTLLSTWTSHSTHIALSRQIILLLSTIVWFGVQCVYAPFLDPVGNASEWTSRVNYVATAVLALVVQMGIGGEKVEGALEGWVYYVVYGVTYGMSFYFTLIDTGFGRSFVKKLTHRIDFSIDIFSPRLDLSLHVKRRIWQESITALLLTSPECGIPPEQKMMWAESRKSDEYPPYLLDFRGSPGERHVENLKILKEVGSMAYNRAVALTCGPDGALYTHVADVIQKHFIGPDSFWNPSAFSVLKTPLSPGGAGAEGMFGEKKDGDDENLKWDIPSAGCRKWFGNAWWIPFPPTLVIRYDDGPTAYLRHLAELEEYVRQNESYDVKRRKEVRMALRALDGLIVKWPYQHVDNIGSQVSWLCCGRRYNAKETRHFYTCTLSIKHHGHLEWESLQLGSGFDIEMRYSKDIILGGDIIGLNDDYDLTPPLARFLAMNRHLITGFSPDGRDSRLHQIERTIANYRAAHRRECQAKADVFSYRFLALVYDRPRDPRGLAESSIESEKDLRVRQVMVGSEQVFEVAYERMRVVLETRAKSWWYVFWDDLWRRNYESISGLQLHATDFDPHYATSIAYTPLPRAALESFLIQRGLLFSARKAKWSNFFNPGLLNKIYLRLNDCVFKGSSRAIMFHLGNDPPELNMSSVDYVAQLQEHHGKLASDTLGTGGGTDHDADVINPRYEYRWEGLLTDTVHRCPQHRDILANMGAWFGVTPLVKHGVPSQGVSVDVRLENDPSAAVSSGAKRFVLIEDEGAGYGERERWKTWDAGDMLEGGEGHRTA